MGAMNAANLFTWTDFFFSDLFIGQRLEHLLRRGRQAPQFSGTTALGLIVPHRNQHLLNLSMHSSGRLHIAVLLVWMQCMEIVAVSATRYAGSPSWRYISLPRREENGG